MSLKRGKTALLWIVLGEEPPKTRKSTRLTTIQKYKFTIDWSDKPMSKNQTSDKSNQ